MPRSIGSRLGHYDVIALIGQGGMGEVDRAKDTKLGRDVALKVLPDLFADDPERLARFQREARVLASLNHPNIASIYGLEEQDGVRALVLELVEQVKRIRRRRLQLDHQKNADARFGVTDGDRPRTTGATVVGSEC